MIYFDSVSLIRSQYLTTKSHITVECVDIVIESLELRLALHIQLEHMLVWRLWEVFQPKKSLGQTLQDTQKGNPRINVYVICGTYSNNGTGTGI